MDPLVLGIGISMIGANVAVLGLVLRVVKNGKAKGNGNPHSLDPDETRLGDVSIAYYKENFIDPIIAAIREIR